MHEEFARFGTKRRDEAFAVAEALGAEAVPALLAWMSTPHELLPEADPRDSFDDVTEAIVRAARNAPDAFLRGLHDEPARLDHVAVVSALGVLDRPEATALLRGRLKSDDGTLRWIALRALAERRDLGLAEHLPRLLQDGDPLVGLAAVRALRTLGSAAHLDALHEYLSRNASARDVALDAVESICARAGNPLPSFHPGLRLETVVVESDCFGRSARVHLCVTRTERVAEEQVLAEFRCDDGLVLEVVAPCDGIITMIEIGPPVVLTLRRSVADHS